MDPSSVAWLNAGSSVLGKAMQSAPTAAYSGAGYLGSTNRNDFGGFTVSTGSGDAYGTPPAFKTTSTMLILAGAAVLALLIWTKKKG